MGYLTKYSLSILDTEDEEQKAIIGLLREENESARYALCKDGSEAEPCKWYEHHEDLAEFSKRYPEKVFLLEGDGEESGDFWRKYFKNGEFRVFSPEFVWPEYDEEGLFND
jgi:hypothetical protein